MAEQVQSVEEPQTQNEDSTATTLAEFAKLLYRVANDLTNADSVDPAQTKVSPARES